MHHQSLARRIVPPVLVVAGLLLAWYGWHRFAETNINPHEDAAAEAEPAAPTQVHLSDALIAAGSVTCEAVEPRAEQVRVAVPGRLAYDETQRVSVRLGTAGMLTKINVLPGDRVEAGQVLATMNSPELGTARADQLQRAEEYKLAKRQADWDRTRAAGIHKLVAAIGAGRSPEEIREQFQDQELGAARETLLSAYSKQLLAKSLISRIETAEQSGALPARTIEERRRNFESAGATLQGLIEQTAFDADRAAQASEIAMDDARRRWQIAAGRVATLLGMTNTVGQPPSEPPHADPQYSDRQYSDRQASSSQRSSSQRSGNPRSGSQLARSQQADPLSSDPLPSDLNSSGSHASGSRQSEPLASADIENLSSIEIRAPKSGTVEQRLFSENERVEAGAVLFVLADTSRLWLEADLREPQWKALSLQPGQEITATSPALPDETLKATVVRMGRAVDPTTNAIPLVASIENPYGRLRPGLYVQVELPLGEVTSHIVIPESAVATHARETFVFVTTDDHLFVRRDVRLGKSQDGWSEVIAGLSPGERIATRGVFVLKSELLLENEE
ncbi:MAG: efflux RND transporter periplasmic adaptor subunit [Aureliella sp.]